jgi:dihydroneopterin aldolase/2-amino-4-hydroxy-6-hydroxymethyldihydropteridine diphosphokinase
MTIAFLSLGSNIEPSRNIFEAVRLLASHVKVLKSSRVYLTAPLGGKSQPDYWNCVIEIETNTEPRKLKSDVLKTIEEKLGRKRTEDKFASRTIDIDLILYGEEHFSRVELTIPDPQIRERAFLAVPLYEIEPNLLLPDTDEPVKKIAGRFKRERMIELKNATKALKDLVGSLAEQDS